MSFIGSVVSGYDGVSASYHPARKGEGYPVAAAVYVELDGTSVWLSLSIEDARHLAERLPVVLAEHDAAEAVSSSDRAA